MIDGYALIAINEVGSKSICTDHHFIDVRLYDLDCYNLEDWLTPDNLKDCLVMVFFAYKSVRSGGWEYVEYEDCFIPLSHTVIQNGYKEFWREQISIQITNHGHENFPSVNMSEDDEHWANKFIEEWEMLYDEEFEVHPKWLKENEKSRKDESDTFQLLSLIK